MSKRLTQDEFIARCIDVHGYKFSFEKVKYIDYNTQVELICDDHGSFWQLPSNFLRGTKCPQCAIIDSKRKQSLTIEQFAFRAQKIHQNKYDYTLAKYVNNNIKISY